MKIGAVVPAYNEEDVIQQCLSSLTSQSVKINPIVLVDDGSTDNTSKISKKLADVVIRIEKEGKNRLSSFNLAEVYNHGFDILKSHHSDLDYVLVVDADTILPVTYVENLLEFMQENNLDFASGAISGEESIKNVRGSGRIISWKLFSQMDYNYPINYGFDSYPAHVATKYNLNYDVANSIKYKVLRPTSMNYTKNTYVINGRGFRAYGYLFPFALKSFLTVAIKQRSIKPVIFGIYGYISLKSENMYNQKIRDAVRKKQIKKLLRKLKFT